ncbi:MAG TPA: efflux RND transporter periplasmic adaptor subunit [Vicinamibacteria bacterium]|nr:efflux RND transporter periplasmic adaptor subunit [Vicinamibacteria bacterium]
MKACRRLAASAVMLPCCLAAGCRDADPAAKAAARAATPAAVSVARVRRGPISRTVELPAVVRPLEQAVIYAKVAGYLKSIRVDKGDAVREGELLAEIEAPELLADETRLKAELAVAEVAWRRISEAQKKAPDLVMPQTVDDAKGRLEVARANLERNQTLLAYTHVRAPLSGVVTRRFVDPGAFVPAATSGSVTQSPLVTIMDLHRVRIDVAVPEPEVPLVRTGLPLQVAMDELPGETFSGRVTRFAYALEDASRTMTAEAEVENPGARLRPGMYARAQIAVERHEQALLVPAAAILAGKGQDFAFTISADRARRVQVEIGFRDAKQVEVQGGLALDQPVILLGDSPPNDGQPVKATEAR